MKGSHDRVHVRLAVQAFVLGEIRFPVPGARLSTQGLFELEQLRFRANLGLYKV